MSYNPNIPQATDDLSDSQGDILQNFLALDTSFGRDHLPFSNLTADNGKHKFVEIVSAGLPAPAPGLSVGSGTIYTKSVGGPLESQLFYSPDASGAEFQLTTARSASISQFGVMNPYGGAIVLPITLRNGGWTFLPGALILQYGQYLSPTSFSGSTQGARTVPFPISFPVACFVVNVSWSSTLLPSANALLTVSNTTANNFQFAWNTSSGADVGGIFWWAIGA